MLTLTLTLRMNVTEVKLGKRRWEAERACKIIFEWTLRYVSVYVKTENNKLLVIRKAHSNILLPVFQTKAKPDETGRVSAHRMFR